jgi:hypothetical protein
MVLRGGASVDGEAKRRPKGIKYTPERQARGVYNEFDLNKHSPWQEEVTEQTCTEMLHSCSECHFTSRQFSPNSRLFHSDWGRNRGRRSIVMIGSFPG